MVEVTDTDSLATRRRILEEFEKVQAEIATNPELWRKLSFEAHKELCKVLGADFMDYPEFEFWFSRFARGDIELDYDRSTDPKARSLTDLPLDIFEKVAECLELHDRMQLRDVCKDIRFQVDNWDPKVTEFCYFNANHCNLCQKSRIQSFCPRSVLKLPKLQLEKLSVNEDGYWREFIRELDKSNRKLYVKNVEFQNFFSSSKFDLHFMVPGVLEDIKMYRVNPTREELHKIVESEQCQSAKMVYIRSWTPTSQFPLDALYNCPRFTLRIGERPANKLKAKFLKKLMKYGKVQTCAVYGKKLIMNYFKEPKAMVPNFPSLRRYPIEGTNEFYELEYQGAAVRLKRKQ